MCCTTRKRKSPPGIASVLLTSTTSNAPLPLVTLLMNSTGSVVPALQVWVAPKSFAISAAGGITADAGKKIYVLRKADNGMSDMLEVDTEELFRNSNPMWNIPIVPGDVVTLVSTSRDNAFDNFSYREYLDIRGKSAEDPLIPEVRRRIAGQRP